MMWFITCDHDWCSWIGLRCHGPPQWLRPKYAKCWSSFLDVCVFCCKTQMVDGCFFRFFNFHELRIFPASNTIFHGWTTMFQGENTLNNHHLFWDFSDDFLGQNENSPGGGGWWGADGDATWNSAELGTGQWIMLFLVDFYHPKLISSQEWLADIGYML